MANFEAFRWNFSLSINLLFLKSDVGNEFHFQVNRFSLGKQMYHVLNFQFFNNLIFWVLSYIIILKGSNLLLAPGTFSQTKDRVETYFFLWNPRLPNNTDNILLPVNPFNICKLFWNPIFLLIGPCLSGITCLNCHFCLFNK